MSDIILYSKHLHYYHFQRNSKKKRTRFTRHPRYSTKGRKPRL